MVTTLLRPYWCLSWAGGEALLMATSDHLPFIHPHKDGRAIDSCFAFIGAHQCGVLIRD